MGENFYIEFEKAVEIVLSQATPFPKETVSLFDSYQRVLAEDVKADFDNPPVNVSAMDGYGVRSEDLKELPAKLKVVETVPAGKNPSVSLSQQEAVKLFTGSQIPRNCDTVVPVEFTEEEGEFVIVKKAFPKGANIRLKGEDFKKGDTILERGTILTPVEVGILASLNRVHVKVSVKPRVGIITTGTEVVEPGEEAKSETQIRNSNGYSLYGLVKEAGGEPVYFGVVEDNKEKTKEVLEEAFQTCDIVVTSGGISTGDYDFIRELLPKLGVTPMFYKLKVKPGKPVFFGKKGKRFIFSLPGFPVSTVVSFNNLVFPFIRKLLGAKELFRKKVKGVLLKEFRRKKADRLEFARCKYIYDVSSGTYKVLPFKRQGSGNLALMKGNVGLIVVPIGKEFLPVGSEVEVILIK